MHMYVCVCVCVCGWVGASEASVSCLLRGRQGYALRANNITTAATAATIAAIAACLLRRALHFIARGLLASCRQAPYLRFRGCALPIGKTRRGCAMSRRVRVRAAALWVRAQAADRCCDFQAVEGWLLEPRPFIGCGGGGGGGASASCAATRRFSAATQAQDAELRLSAACAGCATAAAAATTTATTTTAAVGVCVCAL